MTSSIKDDLFIRFENESLVYITTAICTCIILARELIISAFRQIAASKNFVMAADKLGKIKAIITDVAVLMFFLVAFFNDIALLGIAFDIINITSYVLMGIAVLLTIVSAINYIVKNRRVLKEEKTEDKE